MIEKHFTRSEAYDRGLSDSQIRSAVKSGTLTRIRHGALADTQEWAALSVQDQYLARIRAAVQQSRSDSVVSHQSAAVLHRLPLLKPDVTAVHFSANGSGGGGRGERTLHRVALSDVDLTVVDGICVTTLARTAVDVACAGTFDQAVCIIESALRAGATENDIDSALSRLGKRRGIAVARRAAAFADGATESIGESWSRARMAAWKDIPLPRLQHEFRTASGLFLARTDFDWDGLVVGEFDGKVKYGGGATEAVLKERQRENALQALGIHVIRWTWEELLEPEKLYRLLRDALDRAGL